MTDEFAGTVGGSGVRRNHQQTGDGVRKDWSGHGVDPDKGHFSMDDAQVTTAVELESAQRGIASRKRKRKQDTQLNLNPFAVRRPKGTWHAIRGVTGPRDEIRREALALLIAGFLDTPTPTPEEVNLAREARDGAIAAAERRTAVNTSPPGGLAAVKPPMTLHEAANPMSDGARGL